MRGKGGAVHIMVVAPPPWATSGYGIQCRRLCESLQALGHQVAVLAYAGVHEETDWHGITILSNGGAPYANGTIAGSYQRWGANLLVLLTDPWVIDPTQLAGLAVAPLVPVDCDPLGAMDHRWLDYVNKTAELHPLAMSEHARRLLADAGFDAPVVPLATTLTPDPDAGLRWREARKVPPDAFLIVKVGVNNEDDRKAFGATMQAFAQFSRKHQKAALFCHTEPQAKKAPNLAYMAVQLGLQGRVAFPDEYERACDLHDQDWMAGMFNAADVLDAATKGEGFGVPAIEALACGTPVIGCRNSAMTEKIAPEHGWLVNGQRTWARHHNAWWTEPSERELARAYEQAKTSARSMRPAAAREGLRWSAGAMREALEKALRGL